MTACQRYDIAVLGSGFGGSLLGAILARHGLSVVVIDRTRHPRFVIGESSTPAADLILHDLALEHTLPELLPLCRFGSWRREHPKILCGCKQGFSYFWHGGGNDYRVTADHRDDLLVAASATRENADTQWYRPEVDHFFARLAVARGAILFEQTDIVAIEHSSSHRWRLSLRRGEVVEHLEAGFVVDATGPAGLLPRHLGQTEQSDRLYTRSSALYGHWDNAGKMADWLTDRGASLADHPYACDDSVVHHLFDDGWAWQIRFEGDRLSLGFVFTANNGLPDDRQHQSDEHLWSTLCKQKPVLAEMLLGATRAPLPGRLVRTGRLQRLWQSGAGSDWAALPSSLGFIDPLHSTGIAHTLSGVERLARILLLSEAQQRDRQLERYSADITEELLFIDRLVSGCHIGLGAFELFTTWSMVYFAAATTFEKNRLLTPANNNGFLCAGNREFHQLVTELHDITLSLKRQWINGNDSRIYQFRRTVQERLQPFNHVGLFTPAIPNRYHYTAAEKHPLETLDFSA